MDSMVKIIYFVVVSLYTYIKYRKKEVSPLLIFVITEALMFYGISLRLDMNNQADRTHMIIMLTVLILLVYGDFVFSKIFRLKGKKLVIKSESATSCGSQFYIFKLVFLSVVSILVSALFFWSLGYNVFIVAVKSFFSGNIDARSVVELRLGAYSKGSYRGAGYVYQFRNAIFPLVVLGIYYLSKELKNQRLKIFSILNFPLVMIFSLGSGQRGGFVMIFLMYLLSVYFIEGINSKQLGKLLIVFLIFWSLMSMGLGRAEYTEKAGYSGIIKANIDALIKRIIGDNQAAAVRGFRYVYYDNEIQYGLDWFKSLRSLLPGRSSYTSLSTRIFALTYGSTRGTAPPSIWGSVWYNWGPMGIILGPIIISFFYVYAYKLFVNKKSSIFRVICFSSMFVIMGFWIAGGPIALINTGLLTVIILYFFVEKVKLSIAKAPTREYY